MAILWADGGGINPDQITIVYADENIPLSKPDLNFTNGTIASSSTLYLDPSTFDPPTEHAEQAYADNMVLMAIETGDCNTDGQIGVTPFQLTQPPGCSGTDCERVRLNHNPAALSELNPPGGFNGEVQADCTVIGLFHVVQYRINPLPPTPKPMLERRDLSLSEPWIPVAANIENLQMQYGVGFTNTFVDVPSQPLHDDPNTWITRVRVTIGGRSASKNLQGASAGIFDAGDTHIRKTFSTVVSLRNQAYTAGELANDNWN
jgi:hypothetical protein